MNKFVEKLLNGEKVEFKTLGEVAELKRGKIISKQYLLENLGDYPVYSSQTINNGEIGRIDTYDFDGEFVNWTTDGANAGTVFYRKGKFSITNVSGLIEIKDNYNLNYKFLYYWLSIVAKNYVYNGMGNPKLMNNQMAKIKIPIPPISVQTSIVEILDKFTELTAELTTELTLRRKQYNHYLKHLLSENEFIKQKIKWEKLGDICETLAKGTLKKEELVETGRYFVVNSGRDFYGKYDKYNNSGNTFTLAARGEYAGFVSYINEPFWAGGLCYPYRSKDENMVITNFIYFYLKSIEDYIMNRLVSRGSIPAINKADIDKLKIPIPTTEMQKKITTTLNTFNTIILKLSYEIELRKKQYEYYCNLLLNFK